MQIPKKITVGTKTYSIIKVKHPTRGALGVIDYQHAIIFMASLDKRGEKLGKAEMADTFWHELTHAILNDMGEFDLNMDERFVTRFANRLSQAVDTAKL
jgi:hypothetical protein